MHDFYTNEMHVWNVELAQRTHVNVKENDGKCNGDSF